jgi:hypothetical protein
MIVVPHMGCAFILSSRERPHEVFIDLRPSLHVVTRVGRGDLIKLVFKVYSSIVKHVSHVLLTCLSLVLSLSPEVVWKCDGHKNAPCDKDKLKSHHLYEYFWPHVYSVKPSCLDIPLSLDLLLNLGVSELLCAFKFIEKVWILFLPIP